MVVELLIETNIYILADRWAADNMGFAKIRADGSYLRLFVILLCFISGLTLSI